MQYWRKGGSYVYSLWLLQHWRTSKITIISISLQKSPRNWYAEPTRVRLERLPKLLQSIPDIDNPPLSKMRGFAEWHNHRHRRAIWPLHYPSLGLKAVLLFARRWSKSFWSSSWGQDRGSYNYYMGQCLATNKAGEERLKAEIVHYPLLADTMIWLHQASRGIALPIRN